MIDQHVTTPASASAPGPLVTTEPIIAWRAWTLTASRRGIAYLLRPLIGSSRPWPPGEPASASCVFPRRHRAPDRGCTCGLYAVSDGAQLRRARSPAVIGTVAMWGRVIEHEFGFRSEWAYPQRLQLVCHLCIWQHGYAGVRTDAVVRLERGRLFPLCERHLDLTMRCGIRPREIRSAGVVERTLLDEYAVDLLRIPRGTRPSAAA